METRQPFFKPLEGQTILQNEKVNRGTPFFAPLNQHARMQGHEQTQQNEMSKEKISSLHSKLYQEADKIRKWKTFMEIEIKQKDKKLQEASTTIEGLRKSVMEIQIQNENLSLKYQEEVENREEISQKINSTRDMCNLLKGYTAKVEERLEQCEGERSELQNCEKKQTLKFEDLSKKFKDLEIAAVNEQTSLRNQIHIEREEKKDMKNDYEKIIHDANIELEALSRQCRLKEECITSVSADMKLIEEKFGVLQVEHAFLQEKFQQVESQNTDLTCKLSTTNEALDNSKGIIITMEQVVNDQSTKLQQMQSCNENLEKELSNTEQEYVEKLQNMRKDYDNLREQAEKDGQRLKEVESALGETEQVLEETKCAKDMLLLERSEIKDAMQSCQASEARLSASLFEKEERLSVISREISEKNSLIEQMLGTKKDMEEEIEKLKSDLQEALLNEKAAYEAVDDIRSKFADKNEECRSRTEKLKVIFSENTSLQKQIETIQEEKKNLKHDLTNSISKESKSEEKITELESSLKMARDKQEKMEEQHDLLNTKLEQEITNVNDFKENMEKKEKEVDRVETKTKALKAEVVSKNKQIKELEKEIRSLKGRFTAKEKADVKFEEAYEQLKNEASTVKDEAKSLTKDLEEQKQQNKELDHTVNTLQAEVLAARDDKEAQTNEHLASKKVHDGEMAKMVSLLEEYKIMNQRTVEEKQKEIETIWKTSKEQENAQEEHLKELENENNSLKRSENNMIEQEKELLKLKEFCAEQKQQIANLESATKTLKDKEKKLVRQENELTKFRETCAKQKEQIKELGKVSKGLKEKEKVLAEQEKIMLGIKEKRAEQEKEITKLRKEMCDLEKLKQKESEVEQLRKEVEHLKVASVSQGTTANNDKKPEKKGQPTNEGEDMKKGVVCSNQRTPKLPSKIPVGFNVCPVTPNQDMTADSGESMYKRRKVMFTDLPPEVSLDYDSDVSSSSELMEVNTSNLNLQPRTPCGKLRTPVIFKPSPRILPGKKMDPSETAKRKPLATTPVHKTPVVENKKPVTKDSANVKRTPSGKPTNRFFKSSPGIRRGMTLGRKPKTTKDLGWFDCDVFGFDPED